MTATDLKSLSNTFEEEISNVPNWQKEIVLQRINENKAKVDAFEMLADLEKELL